MHNVFQPLQSVMKHFVKGPLYGGLLNHRAMVMCNILATLLEACFIYETLALFARSKLYTSPTSTPLFNVLNVAFEDFSNFGPAAFGGRRH